MPAYIINEGIVSGGMFMAIGSLELGLILAKTPAGLGWQAVRLEHPGKRIRHCILRCERSRAASRQVRLPLLDACLPVPVLDQLDTELAP